MSASLSEEKIRGEGSASDLHKAQHPTLIALRLDLLEERVVSSRVPFRLESPEERKKESRRSRTVLLELTGFITVCPAKLVLLRYRSVKYMRGESHGLWL